MKVVILAGGKGTRICEESIVRPKPMIEIGEMPMLWHIMKIYSCFGFNDFVICLGYKGDVIKEYFSHYFFRHADVTYDYTRQGQVEIHQQSVEPWRVTLVETGQNSMTGGRIKRIEKYIGIEPFFVTYGDGVADIDITALQEFHKKQGKIATVSIAKPLGRFGAVTCSGDSVDSFNEKPAGDNGCISMGFFVFEPEIFQYLKGDNTVLEVDVLPKLAREGQLAGYQHSGFFHPMDSMRNKLALEEMWAEKKAPWKMW